MKKAGKYALVTASYSLVSMTQFHCSNSTDSINGPQNGNGYIDYGAYGYNDYYSGSYGGYDIWW